MVSFLLPLLFLSALLPSPIVASTLFLCDDADEAVLLEIKRHFGNPPSFASWDPSTDCCFYWDGVDCYTDGRIIHLSVQSTNISGPVPPQLGRLHNLSSIFFYDNPNLTGPIPASLAKLRFLNSFTISGTISGSSMITGPIPSFLCRLPQLSRIDLSGNGLTGTIPGCFRSRDYLEIDFSYNRLSGPIPPSFLQNVSSTSWARLNLNNNQLTGQIPRSLADTHFKIVDLSYNRFTGDASFLFGAKKDAEFINLSNNLLDFDLSNVSYPLHLEALDLSRNRIRGSISRQVSQLGLLGRFDVGYNRLCGPIPTAGRFGRIVDQWSFVHNKCLCGRPLPPCSH